MTDNPWQKLYQRAINEANGLTNYVEDRPELRSAEKRLAAIETEARAALAQQPAASGEPVAEVLPSNLRPADDGGPHWCREALLYSPNSPHDHHRDGNHRIKLYAAPQPAPAREPLTDAEIDYLAKSVTTTRPGKIAIEFARAIEAAHGILPQQLKDEK